MKEMCVVKLIKLKDNTKNSKISTIMVLVIMSMIILIISLFIYNKNNNIYSKLNE